MPCAKPDAARQVLTVWCEIRPLDVFLMPIDPHLMLF
jgi:hypothetical protein